MASLYKMSKRVRISEKIDFIDEICEIGSGKNIERKQTPEVKNFRWSPFGSRNTTPTTSGTNTPSISFQENLEILNNKLLLLIETQHMIEGDPELKVFLQECKFTNEKEFLVLVRNGNTDIKQITLMLHLIEAGFIDTQYDNSKTKINP